MRGTRDLRARVRGAVVPLVTPVAASGEPDEGGLDRLVEAMLSGRVEGVFVLGTTGEGPSVPRGRRLRIVKRTVARVGGRALVYAGIGDTCLADSVEAGNQYLRAGADVLVAQAPVYFALQPLELVAYFKTLLDHLHGPLVLYNRPATTRVSLPLEVVAQLQGHPNLVGLKDSENDPKRHDELLRRFGGSSDFAFFVGVGALMAGGLRRGAHGIVPSAGNLIPDVCVQACASAARGDWAELERHGQRMSEVAELYQRGRTLGQSLAALKAALSLHGLIEPHVLPPLLPLGQPEIQEIRSRMVQLGLLN
jgi:dihydrodipicolinate synthase/N-acetylneuraminate lyase